MTQQEQPKLLSDSLLADLKETPTGEMGDAARRAGHFSPEDDDSDNRLGKAELRRTLRRIRTSAFWVLFVLLSIFAAFAFLGFAFVLWHWVNGFWDNPKRVEEFVYGVGWTILVSLATLFVERSIPDQH